MDSGLRLDEEAEHSAVECSRHTSMLHGQRAAQGLASILSVEERAIASASLQCAFGIGADLLGSDR
jgi:hypothetical protein